MKPPIYQTKRFALRPYSKTDENRFVEIGTDKQVVKFMGDENSSESSERELFNNIFNIYELNEKRWFWIWGVYENDRLVAHFELKETENTLANELEIVYMVHPYERKNGVMTEVLEFAKSMQNKWGRKIIATVDFQNNKSISLLEKWGIEKKEVISDEENKDEYFKFYLK